MLSRYITETVAFDPEKAQHNLENNGPFVDENGKGEDRADEGDEV